MGQGSVGSQSLIYLLVSLGLSDVGRTVTFGPRLCPGVGATSVITPGNPTRTKGTTLGSPGSTKDRGDSSTLEALPLHPCVFSVKGPVPEVWDLAYGSECGQRVVTGFGAPCSSRLPRGNTETTAGDPSLPPRFVTDPFE